MEYNIPFWIINYIECCSAHISIDLFHLCQHWAHRLRIYIEREWMRKWEKEMKKKNRSKHVQNTFPTCIHFSFCLSDILNSDSSRSSFSNWYQFKKWKTIEIRWMLYVESEFVNVKLKILAETEDIYLEKKKTE